MEDQKLEDATSSPVKVKKWDHLAVRPTTFTEFGKLRTQALQEFKSDDSFVLELMKIYKREVKQ